MDFNHNENLSYYNAIHNFLHNDPVALDMALNVTAKHTVRDPEGEGPLNAIRTKHMMAHDRVTPVRPQPALVMALKQENVTGGIDHNLLVGVPVDVDGRPRFRSSWFGCFNNVASLPNEITSTTIMTTFRYVSEDRASIWVSGNSLMKKIKAKSGMLECVANMLSDCVYIQSCTYAFLDQGHVYMFAPKMSYTAESYFDSLPAERRKERSASMFFHIMRGLYYLNQELSLAHCDIKPANILYTAGTTDAPFKICDLGSAQPLDKMGIFMGTLPHVAPEVLDVFANSSVDFTQTKVNVTAKCDVWSACLILNQMRKGHSYLKIVTKDCVHDADLFKKVVAKHKEIVRRVQEPKQPCDLFDYIDKLGLTEESARPTPETVLRIFGLFGNFYQNRHFDLSQALTNRHLVTLISGGVTTHHEPTYKLARVAPHEMNSRFADKAAREAKVVKSVGAAVYTFGSLFGGQRPLKVAYRGEKPTDGGYLTESEAAFEKVMSANESDCEYQELNMSVDLCNPQQILLAPLDVLFRDKRIPGYDVFRNAQSVQATSSYPRFRPDLDTVVTKLMNGDPAFRERRTVTNEPFLIMEEQHTAGLYWTKNSSGKYLPGLKDTRLGLGLRTSMSTLAGDCTPYAYTDSFHMGTYVRYGAVSDICFYGDAKTELMSLKIHNSHRSLGQILSFLTKMLRVPAHSSVKLCYGFLLEKTDAVTNVMVVCSGPCGSVPDLKERTSCSDLEMLALRKAAEHLHGNGAHMYMIDCRLLEAKGEGFIFNYPLVLLMLLGDRVAYQSHPTTQIQDERKTLGLLKPVKASPSDVPASTHPFGHVILNNDRHVVDLVCARSYA